MAAIPRGVPPDDRGDGFARLRRSWTENERRLHSARVERVAVALRRLESGAVGEPSPLLPFDSDGIFALGLARSDRRAVTLILIGRHQAEDPGRACEVIAHTVLHARGRMLELFYCRVAPFRLRMLSEVKQAALRWTDAALRANP
jgi:hypothetical protein